MPLWSLPTELLMGSRATVTAEWSSESGRRQYRSRQPDTTGAIDRLPEPEGCTALQSFSAAVLTALTLRLSASLLGIRVLAPSESVTYGLRLSVLRLYLMLHRLPAKTAVSGI